MFATAPDPRWCERTDRSFPLGFLALVGLALAGCTGSDCKDCADGDTAGSDTGADDTGATDSGGTRDDTGFDPGAVLVVTVDGVVTTFPDGQCGAGNCGVDNGVGGGPGDVGLGFYLPDAGTGTFTCTAGGSLPMVMYQEVDDQGVPALWQASNGSGTCTVTISTAGSTEGEYVVGTFSATVEPTGGATGEHVLTDGSFSIPVY
jgi:hypothetical protein